MDEINAGPTPAEPQAPMVPPPPPSFPRRFVDVFFSPGRLAEALRVNPRWGLAMLVGALLVALQAGLIPADVLVEAQRQAAIRSGRTMPEMSAHALGIIRMVTPVIAVVSIVVMEFLFAGIVTLIFAFVLGDEGRYRQYLAMVSHAFLIPGVVELFFIPLKVSQKNPQFSVSLGTFFLFLPDGYITKVLSMMTLSQIWCWLVVAAGVHAIDPKRKFATAATVLILLNLAVSMIFALFTPSMR